jgi:hypothetical protein
MKCLTPLLTPALSSKRRGSRDSLSLDRERVRVRVTEM